MRGFVLTLSATAMLAAFTGPGHAAEVTIGGFAFSCKAPDGSTVKPRFGDEPMAYFGEMPEQRDQCIRTVERKIAACDMNTTFASNTEAERYPGCEAIFEEQSKACIAFYRQEMAKCDAGSEDAGTPGDADTDAATDARLGKECPDLDWGGNAAHTLTDCNGPVKDGKRHGHWVLRSVDGSVHEVTFANGVLHGRMSERHADGFSAEGPYVDGKSQGQWTIRLADGLVGEGPYVDDKRHGQWTWRFADGQVDEGPYVDGKMHGQWTIRKGDGSCFKANWSAGEQVGSEDC